MIFVALVAWRPLFPAGLAVLAAFRAPWRAAAWPVRLAGRAFGFTVRSATAAPAAALRSDSIAFSADTLRVYDSPTARVRP